MLEKFGEHEPALDPTAFAHRAAVLIGHVVIGARSSVWPNATLRGDDGPIVIGEETSVQDGCTIHCTEGLSHTTVGSRVTVGHNAVLHGCTIEDECLIGMGAVLLDNVIVERGAIVAAGSLIPPGKIVKAGTLVRGNPFELVRACSDRDRAFIEFSWRAYVRRSRQYLEQT